MCTLCGNPAGPCVFDSPPGYNPGIYRADTPFEDVKLGGDFGEPGGIITWSIAGAGVDITEFRNNTLSRDFAETYAFDVEDAIRDAIEIWAAAGDIDFIQVPDDGVAGSEPSLSFARFFHGRPQEANNFGGVYFPSEDPTGGNIMIADDPVSRTRTDFIDLVLHQIGHLIGLGHTNSASSVMLPFVYSGGPGLGQGDRDAAREVYGAQDGVRLDYVLADAQPDFHGLWASDALRILGNDLDNVLAATARADTLVGGGGDDLLEGRGGNDRLDGGDGFDTALFAGSARAPDRAVDGSGVTITGAEGADRLVRTEEARFEDGAWRFDLAGPDLAFLYRVYDAAFGRTPDGPGLAFWNTLLQQGRAGRDDLAEAFTGSPEFAERYGADPTDEAFIEALYVNALRRAPDPGGEAFWLEAFTTGRLSREDMLETFAESPENVARNAENLEDGVFIL